MEKVTGSGAGGLAYNLPRDHDPSWPGETFAKAIEEKYKYIGTNTCFSPNPKGSEQLLVETRVQGKSMHRYFEKVRLSHTFGM